MTKDLRKIVIAGLAINFVSFIFPLTSYFLFSWTFSLPPDYIWRWTPSMDLNPFSPAQIILILGVNTLLSFYFVYLFLRIRSIFSGTNLMKGIKYGILIYPIGVILPLYSIAVLINVNSVVVIYFAIESFVEFLIYGAICGLVYEQRGKNQN